MSRFEEFLKEEKIRNIRCGGGDKIILIHDLGEWAWENYLLQHKRQKSYNPKQYAYGVIYHKHQAKVYLEIAIGCLGKTEIENRLRAVK